ncbi:MAG: hypothetical protein ACRBF0_16540 [Calditrichia bacterium]
MRFNKLNLMLLGIVLAFNACSETLEPRDDVFDSTLESIATIDDDLTLLKDSGESIDDAAAVFSLGWKQFIDSESEEATVSGHAHAVYFDEENVVEFRGRTISTGQDMGEMKLVFDGQSLDIPKREARRGGVVYSLFRHRRGDGAGSELPFVPGATYSFQVSGAGDFEATSIDAVAPAGLMEITSHETGEALDLSGDLNISWTGGTAESVIVRVVAFSSRRTGDRPMRHQRPESVMAEVTTNSGSHTIAAADLASLATNLESGSGIAIMISQINSTDFTHNTGILRTLVRNGDRVRLVVQ